MRNKPKTLSLVIPAYNEERYLSSCLDAVAAQTVMPDEVIVVDNNSTDKTAEIAQKYSFVKLVKESRQGLVFARTAGFDVATGDLLVRIDSDARLESTWIEKFIKIANDRPEITGFTGRGHFYDVPMPWMFNFLQVFMFQYLQFPAMRGNTLWGANMAIRCSAWEKVRASCHLRNDIDEDIDLTIQLRKRGFKVVHVSSLHSKMSLRRDQTSPFKVARYVSTWPRDYVINQLYFSALYIALLTFGVIVFAFITWPLTLLPPKNTEKVS